MSDQQSSGAGGGSVLGGSVVAGVGLGWLAQHFYPGLTPYGYLVGVLLGFASGLWTILKGEGALQKYRPKPKVDGDERKPDQP